MIRLLLTALLLITTSSMAANKSQAASLSAEQAAKPEIKNFTGIDSPFEEPQNPTIKVNTANEELEDCLHHLINKIVPKLK